MRDPAMDAYFALIEERVRARLRQSRVPSAGSGDPLRSPEFQQAMRRAFNSPYGLLDDAMRESSITVMRAARAVAMAARICRWIPRPLRQRLANRPNRRSSSR